MPKYLALDYISDVMCRKQADRTRMLVACPTHVLKFKSNLQENFAYREPWLKGIPAINTKTFAAETMRDLSNLQERATVKEECCLNFDGIEFHCNFNHFDEVVPSSDPNSMSEPFAHSTEKPPCDINTNKIHETFSPQYFGLTQENVPSDLEVSLLVSSKLLEPLLSVDVFQNSMPPITCLLEKLTVFNILDPTEEVNLAISKFFDIEKFPVFSNITLQQENAICNDQQNATCMAFNLTNVLAVSHWSCQLHEICFDLLDQSIQYKDDMSNLQELSNEILMDELCLHEENEEKSSVMETCISDISEITGHAVLDVPANKLEVLEETDRASLSSLRLLLDESTTGKTFLSDTLYLEETLSVDGVRYLKPEHETAIDQLNLSLSEMPEPPNFHKLLKEHSLLEHTFMLEKLPTVCEGNTKDILLPEPKPCEDPDIAVRTSDSILETKKLLCLEMEYFIGDLDLSLPWDPVVHARHEMGIMRKILHHELLDDNFISESYDLRSEEEFEPIQSLNRSLEIGAELGSVKKADGTSCQQITDVPSIKPKENSVKTYQPGQDSIKETCVDAAVKKVTLNSNETTTENHSNTKPFVPLSKPHKSLDPLSSFMMLIGKHNENTLPWLKTSAVQNDISTSDSIPTSDKPNRGLGLNIKRLRIDRKNNGNVDLPNKKTRTSFPAIQSTPNMMTCSEVAKKEKLSKTIQVCLTGKELDVVCMFEKEGATLLESVLRANLIHHKTSFSAFDRETSRFIVREQQKLMQDRGHSEEDSDLYMLSQLFHQAVSVFYLLVHVSFTSALALLHTTLQQIQQNEAIKGNANFHKHVYFFRECIQKLRVFMCNGEPTSPNKKLLVHPKIIELRSRLLRWFKKQQMREVENPKVVIVCSTCCRYLLSKLCRELSKPDEEDFKDVEIRAVSTAADAVGVSNADIQRIFERTNTLIIAEQLICKDFPWYIVNLIVDYEHSNDSPLRSISYRFKIKHWSFDTVLPSVAVDIEVDQSEQSRESSNLAAIQLDENKEVLVVIGSSKVACLGSLLHLLETRYEMLVIERDYRSLIGNEKTRVHPDVILDEKTCVVLTDFSELGDQDGECVKSLLASLTMMRKMFTLCHVIIAPLNEHNSGEQRYQFSGSVPLNLARLHASVKQLANCTLEFQVKISCCYDVELLASTMYSLAVETFTSRDNNVGTTITNRCWLSNAASKSELFLLHLPCVNSFSAQRLLSVATLREICCMSQEQTVSTCVALNIPQRIAEDVYACLHTVYKDVEFSQDNCRSDASMYRQRTNTAISQDLSKVSHSELPNSSSTSSVICDASGPTQDYFARDLAWQAAQIEENGVTPNISNMASTHQHNGCVETCSSTGGFQHVVSNDINSSLSSFTDSDHRFSAANRGLQEATTSYMPNRHFTEQEDVRPAFVNGGIGGGKDIDRLVMAARSKLQDFVLRNPERAVTRTSRRFSVEPNSKGMQFPPQSDNHLHPESSAQFCTNRPSRFQVAENFGVSEMQHPGYNKSSSVCSHQLPTYPVNLQRHCDPESAIIDSHDGYKTRPLSNVFPDSRQGTNYSKAYRWNSCHPLHDIRMSRFEEGCGAVTSPLQKHLMKNNGMDLESRNSYAAGTSGSVNIGIAQPFLYQTNRATTMNDHCTRSEVTPSFCGNGRPNGDHQRRSTSVIMTPSVRKKMLTYEKIPGSKGGQTRLAFY